MTEPKAMGDRRGGLVPEGSRRGEAFGISDGSLRRDNRSLLAIQGRSLWSIAHLPGGRGLTGVRICSDARSRFLVPTTEIVNTVSAGGLENEFGNLFHNDVKNVVVVGHFGGSNAKSGEMPEGCGGLHAKAHVAPVADLGEHPLGEHLGRYLDEHIASDDLLTKTLLVASKTATTAEKPTLAAVQDHETGILYPIGVFGRNREDGRFDKNYFVTSMPLTDILWEADDLYAGERRIAVPVLEPREIPQEFQVLLDIHERNRIAAKVAYHDGEEDVMIEANKVQNPKAVVISHGIQIPLQAIYPGTFGPPATAFEVTIPPDGSEGAINTGVGQATYALKNKIDNAGTEGPFADTNTVLIQTHDMETSLAIARKLKETEFGTRWAERDDTQILVAQVTDGEVQDIQPFDIAA